MEHLPIGVVIKETPVPRSLLCLMHVTSLIPVFALLFAVCRQFGKAETRDRWTCGRNKNSVCIKCWERQIDHGRGGKKKIEEHFACLQGRKLNCVGSFWKKSAAFELLANCTVFFYYYYSRYPGLKTAAFHMSSSRFYVCSVS